MRCWLWRGRPDQPAPVADLAGLACFNSLFDDMTVNSFLVWDPVSKEAAFFDTGSDGQPMLDFAHEHALQVKQIFLTHIHTDHILDLDRLVEKNRAHAWVNELEPLRSRVRSVPGRIFSIGGLTVESRPTGGHAKGGTTFLSKALPCRWP
jgi:glyoxylase-like metal-dependent hydrolase (beta-lactamase superfamily II)